MPLGLHQDALGPGKAPSVSIVLFIKVSHELGLDLDHRAADTPHTIVCAVACWGGGGGARAPARAASCLLPLLMVLCPRARVRLQELPLLPLVPVKRGLQCSPRAVILPQCFFNCSALPLIKFSHSTLTRVRMRMRCQGVTLCRLQLAGHQGTDSIPRCA